MNGFFKQISLWIIILIVLMLALTHFSNQGESRSKIWSKHFVEQLNLNNIEKVEISRLPDELFHFNVTFREPVEGHPKIEFNAVEYPANKKGLTSLLADLDKKITEDPVNFSNNADLLASLAVKNTAYTDQIERMRLRAFPEPAAAEEGDDEAIET